MGDNIHQLTSLPYHTMEEEHIESSPPSPHVEIHSHSHNKEKSVFEKWNALEKEKKVALIVAIFLTALASFSIIWASFEKSEQGDKHHQRSCKAVGEHQRTDAGLGIASTKNHCLSWGACWDKTATGTAPKCYYSSSNDQRGYSVADMNTTSSGLDILLKRRQKKKIFDSEVDELKCIISYETDSRLRVKIYPVNETRYEVPIIENHSREGHRMQYVLGVTKELFGFSVSRTHETSTTILNTTMAGMIYSDQLLQISIMLSSSKVYGLSGGPNDGLLRRMDYEYQSIWNTEVGSRHGAHPFLMNVENDGHANGILLLNSNAMDVILNPHPAVTFRTTGGILDFYVFLGPTPNEVMQQFTEQVGRGYLPPLWALGYHFGSASYQTSADFQFKNLSVPLEGIWVGSSLLSDNRDMTVNKTSFPDIETVVSDLHSADKYFCVHSTPGVVREADYDLYKAGITADIFVKTHDGQTNLMAKTDAGIVLFPDYFHPDTQAWLQTALADFYNTVPLDGLYLGDNEPATISAGSVTGCTNDKLDNPEYGLREVEALKIGTVCPSALHYDTTPHYNLHNIYAWKHAQLTSRVLKEVKKDTRHMLLSRATYIGSGGNTGHWIQDNQATWQDMKHSIVAMLNYNLYGIPLTGANICGHSAGVVDEELCVRWHQLAVFYPLAIRFTKSETQILNFKNETAERIKSAIEARYSLIPTLYTQFHKAHTLGEPVVSPLFFSYLADKEVLDIDDQFMFAGSIMVAPVLQAGTQKRRVYFPDDVWYDFENPETIVRAKGYKDMDVTLDKQTYYVKGGSVIVRALDTAGISNTKELNTRGDYVLDVYLKLGSGSGELYLDDGVTEDTIDLDKYLLVKFNATHEKIRSELTLKYPGYKANNKIQTINVRGLNQEPDSVYVNDKEYVKDSDKEWTAAGVLCIRNLALPVAEAFMVHYGPESGV